MPIERIIILDRRAFGLKVMQWSKDPTTVPETMEEAEEQLTGIIKFPLPDYIKKLNFIPTTKEVWTIKLPPADMLQDTRDRIKNKEPYTLSQFYFDRVEGRLTDDDTLFEFRVGDYTCSLCA